MKILRKIIVAVFGLILLTSTTCESEHINDKKVYINDIISIDTQSSFNLNDNLYINATLPRFAHEDGKDSTLDIFKTINSNEIYLSDIQIEKLSTSNAWSPYSFIENSIVIEKGKSYNTLLLNSLNNTYEFRIGFKLTESGVYRVRIQPNLESSYNENNIHLGIFSSVVGYNTSENGFGYYQFTVN